MKSRLQIVLSALLLALASHSARANSITVAGVSAVNVPGGSDWTYTLSYDNSTLNNGDFVTINDFGPGSVVTSPAAGWSFSQSTTGPNSVAVPDNASILNATLTWTGGNLVVSPDPSTIVVQTLTLFSPSSVPANPDLVQYTTIDQATSGVAKGTDSRVVGYVTTPTAVPDGGSSLALLGFAVVGLAGLRRKWLVRS